MDDHASTDLMGGREIMQQFDNVFSAINHLTSLVSASTSQSAMPSLPAAVVVQSAMATSSIPQATQTGGGASTATTSSGMPLPLSAALPQLPLFWQFRSLQQGLPFLLSK